MNHDSDERHSAGVAQLWSVIWRWRLAMLAIIFTVVAFSAWQGLHVSPVYKSRAVIEIGYVGQLAQTSGSAASKEPISPVYAKFLEHELVVKQRLGFANWEKRKTPSSGLPRLQEIEIDRRTKKYIELVAYGASPEAARDYLQAIGDKLIAEHRPDFDRMVSDVVSQLNQLRRIDDAIQAHTATIPTITRQSKIEEVALATEKLRLLGMLPGLLERQKNLEMAAAPNLNRPTQYVKAPQAEKKPVSYGLVHHLVIGVLLGLILAGLFVVVAQSFRMKIARPRAPRAS